MIRRTTPVILAIWAASGATASATSAGLVARDDTVVAPAGSEYVVIDVLDNDDGDAADVLFDAPDVLTREVFVDDVGEWVSRFGQVMFYPRPGTDAAEVSITYVLARGAAVSEPATITIQMDSDTTPPPVAEPLAADDVVSDVVPGSVVLVPVSANDDEAADVSTIRLFEPDLSECYCAIDTLVVGEGTWAVLDVDGETRLEFSPVDGFVGDPTPAHYVVFAPDGRRGVATVTIDYDDPAIPATSAPATTGTVLPATGRSDVPMGLAAGVLVALGTLLVALARTGDGPPCDRAAS